MPGPASLGFTGQYLVAPHGADARELWEHVGNMPDCPYLVTKGVLEELRNEVGEFGSLSVDVPQDFAEVYRLCMSANPPVGINFVDPDSDEAMSRMVGMVLSLDGTSTPGYPHNLRYATQRDFVQAHGLEEVAVAALNELRHAMRVGRFSVDTRRFAVFGKLDRYNADKIVGKRFRSIQSSTIFLKLLWLYLFAESDKVWVQVRGPFAVGYDPNNGDWDRHFFQPHCLSGSWNIGFDATGFDRTLPRALIYLFCFTYLPTCCIGLPLRLQEALYDSICFSELVMPDGELYVKSKGNPSGMPNTLRLNSVSMYAMLRYSERKVCSAFSSMRVCGDDAHIVVDDENTAEALNTGLPKVMLECFGVKLKNEGIGEVSANRSIPFVSRVNKLIGNRVFGVLVNTPKVMSRVCNDPYSTALGDCVCDEEFQQRALGVGGALVHHWYARQLGLWVDAREKKLDDLGYSGPRNTGVRLSFE